MHFSQEKFMDFTDYEEPTKTSTEIIKVINVKDLFKDKNIQFSFDVELSIN